jgi:hypothetical protein
MIKRYNNLSLLCGLPGFTALAVGIIFLAAAEESHGASRTPMTLGGVALLILGGFLASAGFGFYAKAKGHSFLCGFLIGRSSLLALAALEDRSGDTWNNGRTQTHTAKTEETSSIERYAQELRESRQHDGDGHVVRIGNRVGSPEVYWSRDQSCWIVVDQRGDSPKVWRTPDIALVRFVGDADCAGQGVAFASENEGKEGCVYIVPDDQPSAFGKLRSLVSRYLSRNL